MAQHQIIVEIRVIANQVASAVRQAANTITSGLGVAGNSANSFTKQMGGMSAAIRATSGVLRAMGTAGFLVGGQFRTLGFALSATSALVQNFAPILVTFLGALSPVGIALAGIVTVIAATLLPSIIAAISEFAIFGAALTEIIKIGFEFNQQYETAKVSIGAVIDQLFKLKDANGRVLEGQEALAGGIQLADEQLKKLRINALETRFTFEELFKVLQTGIAASAGTRGNLDQIRQAVVGLAQLAAARGIPAAQLEVSINQAILGTLRATNRLRSSLADVFGVPAKELNKYIQQLRVSGTLFDELNKKLVIFNLAGKAQAETLPGIINNLTDALQIFSGDVTKNAFEIVKKSLAGILTQIFDFQKLDFTAPFKKLIEILSVISSALAKDFGDAVNFILSKIPEFVTELDKNKNTIAEIYETVKVLVEATGHFLFNILQVFGVTENVKGNLENIAKVARGLISVVAFLNGYLNGIKTIFDAILIVLNYVAVVVNQTALMIASIYDLITHPVDFYNGIRHASDSIQKMLEANFASISYYTEAIRNHWNDATKSAEGYENKLTDIQKRHNDLFSDLADRAIASNDKAEQLSAERKRFDDEEQKAARDRRVSLLSTENALHQAQRNRLIANAQEQLKLLQEGLKSEETALKNQLDDRLISVDNYYSRVRDLHKQDFDAQIREQELLRQAFQQQHDDNIKALNADLKVKREQAETDLTREPPSGVSPEAQRKSIQAKLQSEIDQNRIKVQTEGVRLATEQQRIDATIQEIGQKRLEDVRSLTREQIIQKQATADELRLFRELFTQIIGDNTSSTFIQEKIHSFIDQNKDAIIELQRRIKEAQINAAVGAPKLGARSDAADAQRDLDTIIKSESLRILNEAILNRLALERTRLSDREAKIQQDIALGVIDQEEGEHRLNELAAQRAKSLSAIADQLQAVLEELQKVIVLPQDAIDKAQQVINDLRREAVEASTVTEHVLLKASDDARDSFRTLFEDLQENIGNAKNAFADFALSIIKNIQKILADRFVQELFGKNGIFGGLLSPEGQTQGRATGAIPRLLRKIGLDPNSQQAASAKLPESLSNPLGDQVKIAFGQAQKLIQDLFSQQLAPRIADIQLKAQANPASVIGTGVRVNESGKLIAHNAESLKTFLGLGKPGDTFVFFSDDGLLKITYGIQTDGSLLRKVSLTSSGQEVPVKADQKTFGKEIFGIPTAIPSVSSSPITTSETVKQADQISNDQQQTAALNNASGTLTTINSNLLSLTQSISVLTNTFQTMINIPLSTILEAIRNISLNSSGGGDLSSLLDTSSLLEIGTLFASSGGHIRGAGTPTSDSIPAMLSDGEFVVRAAAVKALGVDFFNMVNAVGLANGGQVRKYGTGSLVDVLGTPHTDIPHSTSGTASGVGIFSKIFGGKFGGTLFSAGLTVGLALLSRLFAPKTPKNDPNRVKDPYGLNPDTLTFYKHPIIKGVRTYLANGGLVSGKDVFDSFGAVKFNQGGMASDESLGNIGMNAPPASTPVSLVQHVKIETPDIHSFRSSKQTIERELGQMARRGIARHRGRL